MSKRQIAIQLAKVAGYHDDKKTFTRLSIEARVSRPALYEAWTIGKAARAGGMKCHCHECNTPTGTP